MVEHTSQTLLEFFSTVYQPFRMADSSPGGVKQHRHSITALAKYLGRDPLLTDLTEKTLVAWMTHGLRAGLSPVTCNSRRQMILTLWRFAKRKKYAVPEGEDLDSVDKFRVPKRQPQAWTHPEMEAIIESARLCRGRLCGVPSDKWWVAFILTLYDTGLRKNAALGIRFAEIDFKTKMLLVPAERMKNAVEQYFRLSDQTIGAILESLPPRRDRVFAWPFSLENNRPLHGRLRMILHRAGLSFGRRDLFHKFRRTTASHLAQLAGKQAAITQLGHQNQNSINLYIDPRFTSVHDGARILPRPSWLDRTPIEVEEIPAEPDALTTKVVQMSEADLKGSGDDLFASLVNKPVLSAEDIRGAIALLGISHRDFAEDVGVSPQWLSVVLNENTPIKASFNHRIRIALGVEDRCGRPPRTKKGTLAPGIDNQTLRPPKPTPPKVVGKSGGAK